MLKQKKPSYGAILEFLLIRLELACCYR